ncbi:GNAT family N-acetyltransferase [Streptomyces niveus]|uniref:GNAT family N-acetyltransferase n=1 Tax=Streptomyces niveus TaxID=193462 RepID=UPI0036601029
MTTTPAPLRVTSLQSPDHTAYLALLALTTSGDGLPPAAGWTLTLPPGRQPFTHGPALCLTARTRSGTKPHGALFAASPNWTSEHPLTRNNPELAARLDHTILCIYGLAVAPRHRDRGIARTLVTEAETRARNAGYRLSTLIHKPELAPFYKRLGYTTAHHTAIGLPPPHHLIGLTHPPYMTAVKALHPDVHVHIHPQPDDSVSTVTGLLPHPTT